MLFSMKHKCSFISKALTSLCLGFLICEVGIILSLSEDGQEASRHAACTQQRSSPV